MVAYQGSNLAQTCVRPLFGEHSLNPSLLDPEFAGNPLDPEKDCFFVLGSLASTRGRSFCNLGLEDVDLLFEAGATLHLLRKRSHHCCLPGYVQDFEGLYEYEL